MNRPPLTCLGCLPRNYTRAGELSGALPAAGDCPHAAAAIESARLERLLTEVSRLHPQDGDLLLMRTAAALSAEEFQTLSRLAELIIVRLGCPRTSAIFLPPGSSLEAMPADAARAALERLSRTP